MFVQSLSSMDLKKISCSIREQKSTHLNETFSLNLLLRNVSSENLSSTLVVPVSIQSSFSLPFTEGLTDCLELTVWFVLLAAISSFSFFLASFLRFQTSWRVMTVVSRIQLIITTKNSTMYLVWNGASFESKKCRGENNLLHRSQFSITTDQL